MSVVEIFRRDFLDVRRSKLFWIVMSIYASLAAVFLVIQTDQIEYHDTVREATISQLNGVTSIGLLLVPILAFVGAYLAIAGERECGSIKFVLGLPNTRRAVIVGKFLSRSILVGLGIAIAFLVVAGLLVALYPVFPIEAYLVFFGLMVLYAIVYVAIAIGISASVPTKARAAATGFGVYFLLNVLPLLASPGALLRTLHAETLGFADAPILYQFVTQLAPSQALLHAVTLVTGEHTLPADAPFYVQPEFMPAILFVWIVAPLVYGYHRFRSADVS